MSKDIHTTPFDEGTKAKLAIFQDYLREWLPVFLAKNEIIWRKINIFDFFAGPGQDLLGSKGTPLRIIDEIQVYNDIISKKGLHVNLYFNEFKKEKFDQLTTRLDSIKNKHNYNVEIDNLEFNAAFDKYYPIMNKKDCVNLLFLDQNGIKHISEEVFKKIIDLKQTDFLFFISSSTIKRFSEHPNIKKHISISVADIEQTDYHKIHKLVLDFYKSLIPDEKNYYLAPFSLKKTSGLFGLIFGSGHPLGIEKFLTTCWKLDPERGEANFDIDNDHIVPGQYDMFTANVRKPKKVDLFERELIEGRSNRLLCSDKDIYLFTISNGFLPSHARTIIKQLISEKKIQKCSLNITHKICKPTAQITKINIL